MLEIKKNYREDAILRKSLNTLAEKTFCISFESWYQNGFWTDNYIPYSAVDGDRVVANVSVNRCNMQWNGEKKELIQLGTVMTDPEYRGKGLSRMLMEEVEKDYAGKVDGIFLFANDSVLDFYPRFGFQKLDEHEYSKAVAIKCAKEAKQIPMNTKEQWDRMVDIINRSCQCGKVNMIDNAGLFMFYLHSFMQENVYYIASLDAYAVAQVEEENLYIDAVFSNAPVNIDAVINAFGEEIHNVTLGFVPQDGNGFDVKVLHEEGTTLFVKGAVFDGYEEEKLRLPSLSHA